jgi:peptidoglycan hydrolase-like protein with peptidoglycan-binding domain/surface antigen
MSRLGALQWPCPAGNLGPYGRVIETREISMSIVESSAGLNRLNHFTSVNAVASMLKHRRCARSIIIAAAILLISGCSQLPGTAGGPAAPSTSTTPAPKAPTTARPADPEVRAAQEALAGLGYYQGPIDGIAGPKTRAAVADYQTDRGLSPDGKVSRELLAQLVGAQPIPVEHDKDDPAEGPIYERGDTYTYTDGHVETVQSVNGRRVQWQDAMGLRWSADPDFSLPPGRSDSGAIIAQHRALSWPLHVGATAAYIANAAAAGQRTADRNTADHWQCSVESREQISVAAGIFDTYKIVCRLDGDPLGTTQSRTWYYAPAVGHYVRYIDNAAAPSNDVTRTRSRDLIAVSPGASGWPSEARTGLEWAVSHALEAEPDGQPVPWESSAIAARFVIEPGGQVDAGHSGQCRRFSQTRIAADGATRLYPGVACRSDDGRWRILGLDGEPFERTASSS